MIEIHQITKHITIEMRHSVVFPTRNVVQQGSHAFMRCIASQLVVHLQDFSLTHKLSCGNTQVRRKELSDCFTTCETERFSYQTTRLSPE